MRDAGEIGLDDVRTVVDELVGALAIIGAGNAASILSDARSDRYAAQAEELLLLRSTLVRTRAEWEVVGDPELVGRARSILRAAKRLAIDQ